MPSSVLSLLRLRCRRTNVRYNGSNWPPVPRCPRARNLWGGRAPPGGGCRPGELQALSNSLQLASF